MLGWHTTRRAWLVTPSKQLAGWALDDINTRHYLYESGPYTIPTPASVPDIPELAPSTPLPDDVITVMARSGVRGIQRIIGIARGSVSPLVRMAAMAPEATIALCRKSTEPLAELIPTVQNALSHLPINPEELVHLVPSLDTPLDWIILGYVVNASLHHWGGGTNQILIGKAVALWAQAGYWQVADVLATTIRHRLPMDFYRMSHNVQLRHYDPEYSQRIKQYFIVPPMNRTVLSFFEQPVPRPYNTMVLLKVIAQAAMHGIDARLDIFNVESTDLADEMAELTPGEYQALYHTGALQWVINQTHSTLEAWLDSHMADYDSAKGNYEHIPVHPDGTVAVAMRNGVVHHIAIKAKYGYRMARTRLDFERFWTCDLSAVLALGVDQTPLYSLLRALTKADSTLAVGTPQQAVIKCGVYMRLIKIRQ